VSSKLLRLSEAADSLKIPARVLLVGVVEAAAVVADLNGVVEVLVVELTVVVGFTFVSSSVSDSSELDSSSLDDSDSSFLGGVTVARDWDWRKRD
jgi:hypothetical protein